MATQAGTVRYEVRLQDARGCWRLAQYADLEQDASGTVFFLRGNVWSRLGFKVFGRAQGLDLLVADRPAIGGLRDAPELCVPLGWQGPDVPGRPQ